MSHPLAVVLVPGPGRVSETLVSLRDEIARGVPLVGFGLEQPDGLGGVAVARSADEVLAAADALAFVRTGDRLRDGALRVRLRPFAARPEAMLSVAGYRLVAATGARSAPRRHRCRRLMPTPCCSGRRSRRPRCSCVRRRWIRLRLI